MSHNKRLNDLIARISLRVDEVRTDEDWVPVFQELKEFEKTGSIEFQHRAHWIWFACLALGAVGYWYIFVSNPRIFSDISPWGLIIGIATTALVAIPAIVMFSNKSDLSSLSDRIFNIDVLFDNDIRYASIQNGVTLWESYAEKFGEFSRGDESREITQLIKGTFAGEEHSFDFTHHEFKYVVVTYVWVSNGKGGGHLQRQTTTHYRYGIQIPFPFTKGRIAIVGGGGSYEYRHSWKTPSIDFAKAFDVYVDDEMVAARFLQPSVISAILDTAQYFYDLNIEVSEDGVLCISFDDDNVVSLKRQFGVENPGAFEEEIKSHLGLPKLRKLQWLVHELIRFND